MLVFKLLKTCVTIDINNLKLTKKNKKEKLEYNGSIQSFVAKSNLL